MIYELRCYDINPNRWEGHLEWCEQWAVPLFFDQFKFPLVGFFEVMPCDDPEHAEYTRKIGVRWILTWESMEERDRRWAELGASEALEAIAQKARDEDGNPLFHMGAEVTFMRSLPWSPIR